MKLFLFSSIFSPEGGVGLVGYPSVDAYFYVSVLRISPDDMSLESDGGMIYWQEKTEELG
jgi:hypothetical protein